MGMDGGVELDDLKPLFDYSGVQPVDDAILLDDADSLECYSFRYNGKKDKRNGVLVALLRKKGGDVLVVLDDDGDKGGCKMGKEDEDWKMKLFKNVQSMTPNFPTEVFERSEETTKALIDLDGHFLVEDS